MPSAPDGSEVQYCSSYVLSSSQFQSSLVGMVATCPSVPAVACIAAASPSAAG